MNNLSCCILKGSYNGVNYDFEMIDRVMISKHSDACFQIATNPNTTEKYFFVQEQSGKLADRQYRKQGCLCPATSVSYFQDKMNYCVSEFSNLIN